METRKIRFARFLVRVTSGRVQQTLFFRHYIPSSASGSSSNPLPTQSNPSRPFLSDILRYAIASSKHLFLRRPYPHSALINVFLEFYLTYTDHPFGPASRCVTTPEQLLQCSGPPRIGDRWMRRHFF